MCYSEGLDRTGVSDLASAQGHEGTRTNKGPCAIYITEKYNIVYRNVTQFSTNGPSNI